QLLFGDVEDEWFQLAALTAKDLDSKGLLSEVESRSKREDPKKYLGLARRLAEMIGTGSDETEIRQRLRQGTSMNNPNGELEASILQGLVSGLLRHKNVGEIISSELSNLEKGLFEHESSSVRGAILSLLGQKDLVGLNPDAIHQL